MEPGRSRPGELIAEEKALPVRMWREGTGA